MGVNAGEFPAPVASSSYFTERDKITLAEAGLLGSSDNETLYARELFFFSRAFAAASESVTLLYSQRATDLKKTARADVITAILDMTGEALRSVKISDISPLEKIYSPTAAMDVMNLPTVSAALAESGYARQIQIASKDIEALDASLEEETVELMYPGDMALTQTRIDTYVGCPLAYYLRFNLNLSENGRAEFDARNIGTFIHAILENFFTELKERGEAIGELSKETRADMVNRAAKKYLGDISSHDNAPSRRSEILLDRLSRSAMPIVDGLCDEMKNCSFIPRFFELRIGSEDEN
jgi:ATP-dependent helicase/nuclease subunit B